MKFTDCLKFAREIKGLSLGQAAKQSGVSKACIYQYEQGQVEHPSFVIVIKLADFYGIKLDRLAEQFRVD